MSQDSPELLKLLAEIDPRQPLGTPLYDALLRIGPFGTSVEAVCLRLNSKKEVEVYLTQRALNDTAYAGEYHCPGTFVRTDEDFNDTFLRLAEREFGGRLTSWRHIAPVNYPKEARGHCISLVYLCILPDQADLSGTWFPVNNLPRPMVKIHEKRIIPAALGIFVAENTKICW